MLLHSLSHCLESFFDIFFPSLTLRISSIPIFDSFSVEPCRLPFDDSMRRRRAEAIVPHLVSTGSSSKRAPPGVDSNLKSSRDAQWKPGLVCKL